MLLSRIPYAKPKTSSESGLPFSNFSFRLVRSFFCLVLRVNSLKILFEISETFSSSTLLTTISKAISTPLEIDVSFILDKFSNIRPVMYLNPVY